MLGSTGPDKCTGDRLPWWRWPVLLTGWVCLVLGIISPTTLKGGSRTEAVALLAVASISILGALSYLVGRRTYWAKYDVQELRWVFTPMVLSAVIVVGLLAAVVGAAILFR